MKGIPLAKSEIIGEKSRKDSIELARLCWKTICLDLNIKINIIIYFDLLNKIRMHSDKEKNK